MNEIEPAQPACRNCGVALESSRVTHFEKRFCSPNCRTFWTRRRWEADAIIVRRYFFHYLQYHAHEDYRHAGRMQAPCSAEHGHAHAMEMLNARCEERRAQLRCPDLGPDEVPVNGARLPLDVDFGPSLRDSVRVMEDSDPEERRKISYEMDTPRAKEQRELEAACFMVQNLLMRGKCVGLQYDPRVLRPAPVLGDNGLPRVKPRGTPGRKPRGVVRDEPAPSAPTYAPLERTIMPGETIPDSER